MSDDWRNEAATEDQKEKLRFFGCTWDEGITAGQANDAIQDCAKQFPDAEAAYQKSLPATDKQKEKLRFFGCTWNGDITVGKASDALEECAKQFPYKEAAYRKSGLPKWPEAYPATQVEINRLRARFLPQQSAIEHEYTPNGFCKNCGWERSFIEKTQRACLVTQADIQKSGTGVGCRRGLSCRITFIWSWRFGTCRS